MELSNMTKAPTHVDAKVIAAFLKITETSVYALAKGVRGWKKITPLPAHETAPSGGGTQRMRLSFDLDEVRKWVAETQYKPARAGSRTRKLLRKATS